MNISEEEKGILLMAAKETVNSLFTETSPSIIDFKRFPILEQVGPGAFVTLTIDSQLRGCIGYIVSDKTVFDTVCDAAKQAAIGDPRFPPLTFEELDRISIEISLLSSSSPIKSFEDIEIGKHGLLMEKPYRALLLPQVAVEHKFNVNQFLTALCEKAGINPYAWKTEPLNIKVFTAVVFSDLGKRKRTYEQN